MRREWFAVAAVLLLAVGSASAQTCNSTVFAGNFSGPTPVPTSACAGVIDYSIETAGTCSAVMDQSVASLPTLWSTLSVGTNCRRAVAVYACTATYKRCGESSFVPCQQLCISILTSCTPAEVAAVRAQIPASVFPPDCAVLPTTSCSVGPTDLNAVTVHIPSCQPLPDNSVCSGVSPASVYVPAGVPLAVLEGYAAKRQFLFTVAPLGACLDSFARYMCGQLYTPCDSHFGPPLPQLPCRSVCDAFESNCRAMITAIPALTPNCSSTGGLGPGRVINCNGTVLVAGQPNFPINRTSFNPSGTLFTNCNRYVESDGVTPQPISVTYTCPAPLVIPDNPDADRITGINCAAPCPTLVFSDSDYDEVTAFMKGCSAFSFMACTFVFLTWLVHPKKRAGKGRYVFAFNVSIFALSIVILIPVGLSGTRTSSFGCKNNSEDINQSDGGYCIWSSIVMIYFVMTTCLWWWLQSCDLVLTLVMNWRHDERTMTGRRKEWAFQAIAWGFPVIQVIVAAACGVLGNADGGVGWCLLHGRKPGYGSAQWIILYFPILIFVIWGTINMGLIIRAIVRSSRATKTFDINRFIRPVLFIAVFLLLLISIFSYRSYAFFNETKWTDAAADWIRCLVIEQPQGLAVCDSGKPSTSPNTSSWFLLHFAVGGQGIVNFLIYGLMTENVTLWFKTIGNLCGIQYCKDLADPNISVPEPSETDTPDGPGSGRRTSGRGSAMLGMAKQNSFSSKKTGATTQPRITQKLGRAPIGQSTDASSGRSSTAMGDGSANGNGSGTASASGSMDVVNARASTFAPNDSNTSAQPRGTLTEGMDQPVVTIASGSPEAQTPQQHNNNRAQMSTGGSEPETSGDDGWGGISMKGWYGLIGGVGGIIVCLILYSIYSYRKHYVEAHITPSGHHNLVSNPNGAAPPGLFSPPPANPPPPSDLGWNPNNTQMQSVHYHVPSESNAPPPHVVTVIVSTGSASYGQPQN